MYIPESFKEDKLEVLHAFMRANPLGLLVSNGEAGPLATSIPFHLLEDGSKFGTLQAHLARANQHWKSIDGQNVLVVFPWKVSDAPESYIDAQIKAIVGIEIKIEHLAGKWKLSQNRQVQDRQGVVENLSAQGNTEMSKLVQKYSDLKEEA